MILQSLVGYYQREVEDSKSNIAPIGFEKKDLKFIIEINENGEFLNLVDTRDGGKQGKTYILPRSIGRSGKDSWKTAFLLWDHYGYLLGCAKGKEDKDIKMAQNQHSAFCAKLESLPEDVKKDEGVAAVLKFYKNGGVEKVLAHKNWPDCLKISGCNLSFKLQSDTCLVPERRRIQQWVAEQSTMVEEDAPLSMRCLVSGEVAPVKRLHSKFLIGGQQAALVSFQKDSGYDSYGKEQAYNAPVSEKAEFEYSSALKTLLNSNRNRTLLAGMTLVFWAQPKTLSEEQAAEIEEAFAFFVSVPYEKRSDANEGVTAVKNLFESVYKGKIPVDTGDKFYVLGLTPNKARIAVKLWKTGTISEFSERILTHFNDFDIVHSPSDNAYPTLRDILVSTTLQYKSENIPPNLADAILLSVLNGAPYPSVLYQQAIRRIHAEQEVTRTRAAILKAYLNRLARGSRKDLKEVAMSLDRENKDVAYRLGRLFAVLEKIQEEANPGLNATIKDRYYGAISSNPATVFPLLMRLKNHHLAKIETPGKKNYFEREIGEIIEEITSKNMPKHLSLEKQGYFAIGYYHQRQSFFTKQEKL